MLLALMTVNAVGQTNAPNERIAWKLPTENHYLLEGKPEKFFQPTISRRLKSGMFGFVRTSEPEPARIFERFHKGIDIRPSGGMPEASRSTRSTPAPTASSYG